MEKIYTSNAPSAIGPYSQGYMAGGFIFTSGQIAINPQNCEICEGITAQTEQCCKNVAAILDASGSGMHKVVKTTCYLADMAYFEDFNHVYSEYFISKPARSCVAVKQLPRNVLCEIEAIAVI